MSQPFLSTAPLFQTSLRTWQARWKASQGQGDGYDSPTEPPASTGPDGMRSPRFNRFKRRTRRQA